MSEHGTRTRYVTGCRCEPCTAANRDYARQRERRIARIRYGIEQPTIKFVDATETRQHLQWLRSQHIGLRTVSTATGIGRTALQDIASGVTRNVLLSTESAILAVGRTGHSQVKVDATLTWKRIAWLQQQGWSKSRIARELGYRSRALQFRTDRVSHRTEQRVEELVRKVLTDAA